MIKFIHDENKNNLPGSLPSRDESWIREPLLEIKTTDHGEFLGSDDFIKAVFEKFDRWKKCYGNLRR